MPCTIPCRIRRQTLALTALFIGTTAHAQISIDRQELVLRPDSVAQRSGVLMVRNTGRSTTTAVIRVEDWDRGVDGAHRFFDAGTQPGSCASVLSITPLEFTLAPNEGRAVQIGVDGVVNSACWSLVLVETEERVRDETGRFVLSAVRTGMKVYAEPSDSRALGEVSEVELEMSEAAHTGVVRDGSARDTSARDTSARDTSVRDTSVRDTSVRDTSVRATSVRNASAVAAVTFRNLGERHLRGAGWVEIRRHDDRVLTTIALPELQTLPGAMVTARVALPASLKGTFRLRAVVEYGGTNVAAAEREAAIP